MKDKQEKKTFKWQPGSQLDEESYDALGQVREKGFSKLANGIHADPVLRKESRKARLSRPLPKNKEELFQEESESGLNQDFKPADASRLIHKSSGKMQGVDLFKDKSDKQKKPE